MSLQDFWLNVRTSARLVERRAIVDSPRFELDSIEHSLQGTTFWLTLKAVAGYDEKDFEFLPDSERRHLTDLVAEFRRVASTVPPTIQTSDPKVKQATPLFRDIVATLEFDCFEDAEAFRLGKQIEQVIQADRLVELRFSTGLDSTGDPAIWIWAILTDEAADRSVFARTTTAIRDRLESISRAVSPDRWPHIRFRTLSEQAEVVEVGAR